MKKILTIIGRDIKSGTRDWLIIYLSIAPILFALVIKGLMPGVESTTLNVVMQHDTPADISEYMESYFDVEYVSDLEAMNDRILRLDDVYGVVYDSNNEGFETIMQGNESADAHIALGLILDQYGLSEDTVLPVTVEFSDVGWEMSPLKLYGANIIILFTTVLGGMMILLNLVEEKMNNTLSAVNVSPITRTEFIIGKGSLGVLLALLGSIAVILILDFGSINYLMLLTSLLAISFISAIVGFGIGVVNDEPIAAIASMKVTFVPVLASIFGSMYLPEKWHFILFWSPFYWAYNSIRDILLKTAQWNQILLNSFIILVLTAILFFTLRKRIAHGLK
ncbi:ABC transporter permease [Alkalibacter mobilis]|uniref:ABC transporter permease n=1 Tax=Alkalibacter mobilis TaxID=2787712 RepID=UPI0018A06A47|nr:ABC transporter permease [Alkalibacter mobilis]MBF7097148.1 ABC transporter permease [Alkalibacter mobilis]